MKIKHTVAQVLVGFFLLVVLLPLMRGDVYYVSSTNGGTPVSAISKTLWEERLPELYIQILFLGTAIIASLLAIRKPPAFAKDELEKIGLDEEVVV